MKTTIETIVREVKWTAHRGAWSPALIVDPIRVPGDTMPGNGRKRFIETCKNQKREFIIPTIEPKN